MTDTAQGQSNLKSRISFLLHESNARGSKSAKWVTGTIVGLILISAVQVVLESHPGTSEMGH